MKYVINWFDKGSNMRVNCKLGNYFFFFWLFFMIYE